MYRISRLVGIQAERGCPPYTVMLEGRAAGSFNDNAFSQDALSTIGGKNYMIIKIRKATTPLIGI